MSSAPAMISARALGAMPDFVRSELGERSLAATLDHARLPHHIQDSQDGFILEESIIRFVDFAARRLGEDKLGLLLAPFLSVQEYGVWGDYVLSAPTVGDAMVRSCEAIRYHGSRDLLHVWASDRQIRFSYVFAKSGIDGYPDIAYCAVGVMLSLIRGYLGPAWSPAGIALNIRKPTRAHLVEEAFGCPVIYETPDVAIIFDRQLAAAPGPPRARRSIVTLDDVIRARSGGAPRTLPRRRHGTDPGS
ncbi:MAG: AraC family transcriptional regulator ligand-binding domain-containing protein [Bauldia sp.]|nr:AraC family transcriptional regulator ligand-binding domain-containing protein [Bauldia sp.]